MGFDGRLKHELESNVSGGFRHRAQEHDCETWVTLGPHRPGSRPSSTSGSGLPEDPPSCE
jgi:hypothetical protein